MIDNRQRPHAVNHAFFVVRYQVSCRSLARLYEYSSIVFSVMLASCDAFAVAGLDQTGYKGLSRKPKRYSCATNMTIKGVTNLTARVGAIKNDVKKMQ